MPYTALAALSFSNRWRRQELAALREAAEEEMEAMAGRLDVSQKRIVELDAGLARWEQGT